MKNIAVIGAGPAGLATAKALGEEGVQATVFERASDLGGVWLPEHGPTWAGMRTNLSKHTCCFSDLPQAADAAMFPEVPAMHAYLHEYAQEFDLKERIRCGVEVLTAVPHGNTWEITFRDRATGGERQESFDGLAIASGFFSQGPLPNILGQDNFQGRIIHSSRYRDREEFRDRHVTVVGNGLSGVEICADLAEVARSVTHVINRPTWIVERNLWEGGVRKPLDIIFYRRFAESAEEASPAEANRRRNRYLNSYSLQNDTGVTELTIDPGSAEFYPVAISDHYIDHVLAGKIIIEQGAKVASLTADQLNFQKGSIPCNALIFATGFRFGLPYLEEGLKNLVEFAPDDPLQPAILYQSMWRHEVPNLAFIGTYKGPFFGVIELQARLGARLLAGDHQIIDSAQYEAGLAKERAIRHHQPREQFPHPNYVQFADSIARTIGAYPDLDPADPLHKYVHGGGAVVPAHYRLVGSNGKRELAEKVIVDLNTTLWGT